MELVIDIPKSLYANLQKIQNGSIAAKRILECVRNGMSVMYYPQVEGITPTVVEPNTDCVSRQYLIDKAEMQLSEDCISRQAVDKLFDKAITSTSANLDEYWKKLIWVREHVKDLPSVTPAEKVGRWEWVQYDGNSNIGNWHCSECNRIVCGSITAANPVYAYKYCPDCGAKMEEVENEVRIIGKSPTGAEGSEE